LQVFLPKALNFNRKLQNIKNYSKLNLPSKTPKNKPLVNKKEPRKGASIPSLVGKQKKANGRKELVSVQFSCVLDPKLVLKFCKTEKTLLNY
jgi:hypothetical protein